MKKRINKRLEAHFHQDFGMGVANTIMAMAEGVEVMHTTVLGVGERAGNTPMEVFVAVCERMGIITGVDLFKVSDVAEDLVFPMMDQVVRIDRDALVLGYAGIYSSFLLFAKRAEKKYGINARELLLELGRRTMIGGQEDMIEDTAINMARERGLLKV